MAGTEFAFFYWQDWAGDPELKLCSVGAQALWMRLLCIAAESDVPGHVLVGGKRPTDEDLSEICGGRNFPPDRVREWIKELIERDVCSVGRDEVIISRRMVKDSQKRRRNSAGGLSTSARMPRNSKGKFNRLDTGDPTPVSINHKPTPLPPMGDVAVAAGKLDEISRILDVDATPHQRVAWVRQLCAMRESGIDIELDLLPVLREAAAKGRVPPDLRSLAYFRNLAEERRMARTLPAGSPREVDWEGAGRRFLRFGIWLDDVYGPPPTEAACRHPGLGDLEGAWISQGCQPQVLETAQGRFVGRPFWGSKVVALKAAGRG